ncbi:MAG TPA: EcsC family protein [bacterium]|nr:EcsC family protein [bacterium]
MPRPTQHPYEVRVAREIADWEVAEPTALAKLGRAITRPGEWAVERFVPQQFQQAAGDALFKLLTSANEAIHLTVPETPVLDKALKLGHRLEGTADLRGHDLRLSDDLAKLMSQPHVTATALTGAGFGMGGMALLALDLPSLFAMNLRMIQSTARCYGYDLADPVERHYALQLFEASSGDTARKMALLQELQYVRTMIARAALEQAAENSGLAAALMALRKMASRVGWTLSERKLLQIVPLVGAGVGAAFNYQFSRQVQTAAQMGYRKRFLADKYPELYPMPESASAEV